MNGPDSHQFRRISLAEYKSRQENIDGRLTLDDLRSGFTIAEGYMTNTSLAHRDGALAFTTTVELLSPIEASNIGAVGIKLVILHTNPQSNGDNAVERFADAYPQGGDSSAPFWWAINGQFTIRLPLYSNSFREGFLTRWTDNDASDPGWQTEEDIPRELRIPPLLQQRRPNPFFPTERE